MVARCGVIIPDKTRESVQATRSHPSFAAGFVAGQDILRASYHSKLMEEYRKGYSAGYQSGMRRGNRVESE